MAAAGCVPRVLACMDTEDTRAYATPITVRATRGNRLRTLAVPRSKSVFAWRLSSGFPTGFSRVPYAVTPAMISSGPEKLFLVRLDIFSVHGIVDSPHKNTGLRLLKLR